MTQPERKLRKSFRLRKVSEDRIVLLKRALHLNAQEVIALGVEKLHARCSTMKPDKTKRVLKMRLLPDTTCKQLKVVAAHEGISESAAVEQAVLLLARELRLCK